MNNMKKFKHKFTKQQLEDFDAWMEDGNVIKMQDGYATQDAQYRNRLKDLDELKEYFYKEFLREYENGGSADDMTMIGRAIEYLTGTAIERDSIVDKGFKYEFRYKGKTIVTSIDSKLVRDTIYSNKKSLAGRYSDGGEAGFNDAGTSMVMYHEKQGNWLVPKGQVYLYLYDVEDSASKLGNEFDWVFYPLTSQMMAFQRGYIPPLKKIWTKKFQKEHKGSEHLLGVIKAFLIDKDGKQELYIDMMSVNPNKKKKGIMSYMIKDLRDSFNLSQEQVTFSQLTKEGEKFVAKKTYDDGGGVEENNYRISISENDKYIGEYPNPIGSIMEAKTIFVQLATKYKRPQYVISVSRIATSTSGYEKINVDEWYNFAESFKDGGGVHKFPIGIKRTIDEINEMLPKVNDSDEIAGGYFGSTHYSYVQLEKPIEIKGNYVYIFSDKKQYNIRFEKRYNVNKKDDEINGLSALKYDLSIIKKAFKSVLKKNI